MAPRLGLSRWEHSLPFIDQGKAVRGAVLGNGADGQEPRFERVRGVVSIC